MVPAVEKHNEQSLATHKVAVSSENRQTNKQTNKQTDKQTNKQTNKNKNKQKWIKKLYIFKQLS